MSTMMSVVLLLQVNCINMTLLSDCNSELFLIEGLGFLLFKQPDHCPGVVQLLSESYNPHVRYNPSILSPKQVDLNIKTRYGAAMALGIACAGTGNKEALGLIEPMKNDPTNYVRQVIIMIFLWQQNSATRI